MKLHRQTELLEGEMEEYKICIKKSRRGGKGKMPLEPSGNAIPDFISISETSGHVTLVTDAPEPPGDTISGPDNLVPPGDALQEDS